jgi:Uma2 family endonuclease
MQYQGGRMEWSLTGLPLPIVLRPPSPLSDDELIAFSRKNKPYRIEKNSKGEITIMTPVGTEGGKRELRVAAQLMLWADQEGSGEANGPNAGWNLPDGSTLSPDASWIALDRIAGFSADERELFLPVCPDFIIEVRSKSDSLTILSAKMQTWLANGAQLAWMIDPYAATLTIYRSHREPAVLERPDVVDATAPVAGFRLTTSNLWAQPE